MKKKFNVTGLCVPEKYYMIILDKCLDEKNSKLSNYGSKTAAWTKKGFLEPEWTLLIEKNTLFKSLVNKLTDYPELNKMLYSIFFSRKTISYNYYNYATNIAYHIIEEKGRKYFLLYLIPIINGTGNYYIRSMYKKYGTY